MIAEAKSEPDSFPSLADVERDHIKRALAHFVGRKPEAAKALGISLKTLYNKLNAYEALEAIRR